MTLGRFFEFSVEAAARKSFLKKVILKNFPMFYGKHVRWTLFLVYLPV